jgi:hypothetical protein
MGNALVSPKGVKSLRNVDYTTYYALAEIIDNSFQWEAQNIHIVAVQEDIELKNRTVKRIKEIAIIDDGVGMMKETLDLCLQYGGGLNGFESKKMGKFGMGLPNASGSQSSRTEVYSWLDKKNCYFNVLDFDELEKMDSPQIPSAVKKDIPKYITKMVPSINKAHGTVVLWKNTDLIEHKTVAAFNRNLEMFLGKVYRYWLNNTNRNIYFTAFEKIGSEVRQLPDFDSAPIRVMDPLFLMTPNCIPGYENEATNTEYAQESNTIEASGKQYSVRIKCSIVKPDVQEREHGSKSKVNNKFYKQCQGISLIRAGREIKTHDFGFIGRVDTRDRWWSVEVEFGPELDELFKVTNDKQEARGFRYIDSQEYNDREDSDTDESLELMYEISKYIYSNIQSMYDLVTKTRKRASEKITCPECKEKSFENNKCEKCGYAAEYCSYHPSSLLIDGKCSVCLSESPIPEPICTEHNVALVDGKCEECAKKPPVITDDQLSKLRTYLKEYYPAFAKNEKLLDAQIKHFLETGRNHFVIMVSIPGSAFIIPDRFGSLTLIAINTKHPFYDRYMRNKIEDGDVGELAPLNLLIAAMVHAQENDYDNKEVYEMFNSGMALKLKSLMKDYIHK